MAKIEIYSTRVCPYCVKAKNLLQTKGLDYTEYLIDSDYSKMDEMLKRSGGRRTVPQIFINDKHIGGCDELYAANDSGELSRLLGE